MPTTEYASVGDAEIAYQVFGQEPPAPALVQVTGLVSHVEARWDSPLYTTSAARLSTFSRVIQFDRRGAGLSDPLPPGSGALWESWTEDLRAVLDATGCERAALFAAADAGPSAMLFAATYPERTSALFLVNTAARYLVADDYPCGGTQQAADGVVATFRQGWGSEDLAAIFTPSMAQDPVYLEWAARFQRLSATPRAAAAQLAAVLQGDVRDALPLIQAPTVVFQRRAHPFVSVEMGRYLADHIAGARLVELPGADAWIFSAEGPDSPYDIIEEVLTGGLKDHAPERVFATVLVEDIVGSTERAIQIGDRRWKTLLDRHDAAASRVIGNLQGRIVTTTGDGLVATFDSPSRAIRCAQQLRDVLHDLGLEVRIGAHAGEIERRGDDVAGIGVHTAARVSDLAQSGEVLVSRTVCDLVAGSEIDFEDRGDHDLKGVPGPWRLFSVHD